MKAGALAVALRRTLRTTDPREIEYCHRSGAIYNLAEALSGAPLAGQEVALGSGLHSSASIAAAIEKLDTKAVRGWKIDALKAGLDELRSSSDSLHI